MNEPTKKEIAIIRKKIEKRLKREDSSQDDREFYIGRCYDASQIALELLCKTGYTHYKKGVCWVNGVDHCVVYKEVKYFQDKQPYYSGVIDMTAVQFHDEEGLELYHDEFAKYRYGKIPDSHSKKHYKVKMSDIETFENC